MLGLLRSIVDTIVVLVQFVINTISSLVSLIIHIPEYVLLITQSINLLPSFVIPFALTFVSIVVVQYILNRKGQ